MVLLEPPAVRLLPMGERALLVETSDIDAVLALQTAFTEQVAAAARSAEQVDQAADPAQEPGSQLWGEVEEVVPGARTVLLVVTRPGIDLGALATLVREAAGAARDAGPTAVTEEVEVQVRYDGPDLQEVAELTGLAPQEVVAAHTGTPWRVGFGGFAPGFAYLVGGDPRLVVPRRSSPRTRVPAGAVALAGEFSAVYPRPTPGGWQLIGTTDARLFDIERAPPALLRPGMSVRFVEVAS